MKKDERTWGKFSPPSFHQVMRVRLFCSVGRWEMNLTTLEALVDLASLLVIEWLLISDGVIFTKKIFGLIESSDI